MSHFFVFAENFGMHLESHVWYGVYLEIHVYSLELKHKYKEHWIFTPVLFGEVMLHLRRRDNI